MERANVQLNEEKSETTGGSLDEDILALLDLVSLLDEGESYNVERRSALTRNSHPKTLTSQSLDENGRCRLGRDVVRQLDSLFGLREDVIGKRSPGGVRLCSTVDQRPFSTSGRTGKTHRYPVADLVAVGGLVHTLSYSSNDSSRLVAEGVGHGQLVNSSTLICSGA